MGACLSRGVFKWGRVYVGACINCGVFKWGHV